MNKTSLQLWHELQNANASNSNGYMNEFVTNENPLRNGSHVLTDNSIEEWNAKTTKAFSDNIGFYYKTSYNKETRRPEFTKMPISGVTNFSDFE